MTSPTIVLVHGAFSDASIWLKVTFDLQTRGLRVVCPALPMRGLGSDGAYLQSVLANISGPVVLAGHSYGGSVISHPAKEQGEIRALVYVAAFQPEAGESAGELNGRFPGSKLVPDALNVWSTPGGHDVYLKAGRFKEVYAADIDDKTALAMAAMQRPIEASAISETFQGTPRWKNIPSWAVVAKQDESIPPASLRFMAQRAQSIVSEIDASHAAPASCPSHIVQTILAATGSVHTAGR